MSLLGESLLGESLGLAGRGHAGRAEHLEALKTLPADAPPAGLEPSRLDGVLTIGEAHPFRRYTEHLSLIRGDKGVPHAMHVWHERAHSSRHWRRMTKLST